ncbi:MAG: HAMP domain-containing sensor histidine kinase [Myxococcota bacterium]
MAPWRFRILYFVLLPAICVAAGILGYYTWVTASQYERLGEETIADSTLLLVREKVDTVEQYIISQDNLAFRLINLDDPAAIKTSWRPVASELTPSIRALVVLDDTGEFLASSVRGSDRDEFLKVLEERMLPELELGRLRVGRLMHLHRTYAGRNYLFSCKAFRHQGRRLYAVAHHDTAYIVREELTELFATDEGKRQYNVVNEDNRRVFGPSLANAGDYLVGLRFPTTLYNWRLQLAPKQAPLLERQGRSRRVTDLALIGTSFLVVLIGVLFLFYAANKERRLNDLKGEFIANVSHELKTPLSSVRMFGELLLSDVGRTGKKLSDDKRGQYLEIICAESERLTALIENVLDFAALEQGRRKVVLRQGDLVGVIGQAIETFRYRVEREGVDVELDVHGEIPPVALDEQAVVLAAINLMDNAVKYGGRTPVTVSIEPVRDFVQVRVRDRGPGIPPDAEKRIFERFYRSSRDRQHARGSGIGLSLVKHIAAAHGGRAFARNADDDEGGAVVGFALPAG